MIEYRTVRLPDGKPVRLQPDALTRVSHEGHLAAPYPINEVFCRTFVDFTLRQGEHYLVKSEGTPSYRNTEGKLTIGSCKTAIWRQLPSGELERLDNEPRPVPMRIGFSCLMPEKVLATNHQMNARNRFPNHPPYVES